ncbi:MAG TPA: OmpA family protein [Gemmatimonadota bacterium]|nr:OmpA family protein [Gemmatimonadota bacterium]
MSDRDTGRESRAWWIRIALPVAGFTVFGLVALVVWLLVRPAEDRLEPIRTVNQAGDTIVYSGRVRDAVARARIVEALNSPEAHTEDTAGAGSTGDSARRGAAARDARQAAVDELARLYAEPADPDGVVAALNLAILDFAPGGADLPADAAGFIQGAAEAIERVPDGTVIAVAGYPDAAGAPDTALAGRRARVVVDALVAAGADADRLRAVAHDAELPDEAERTADAPSGQVRFELAERAEEESAADGADAPQSDSVPDSVPETPLEPPSDKSSDKSSPDESPSA